MRIGSGLPIGMCAFYSLPGSVSDHARGERLWRGTGGETKHSLEGERPHAPPPAPAIALSAADCRMISEASSVPWKKGTWVRAEGFVRHAVHPGSARAHCYGALQPSGPNEFRPACAVAEPRPCIGNTVEN